MAYGNSITTTILGRRAGLQAMSTNQTGTGLAGRIPEFLVGAGAEDIRKEVTTADTTATSLKAWGNSVLTTGLSADATAIYRLDPPIPGVEKNVTWLSTTIGTLSAKIWLTISTGGGAGFMTSGGSSFTCVASSGGAVLKLLGLTTALYGVVNGTTASGFAYTTTT